jgi:hypothetical protein
MHELAEQAGIELPEVLGRVRKQDESAQLQTTPKSGKAR